MYLLELWKPLKYYNSTTGNITNYNSIEVSYSGKFRYVKNKKEIRISYMAAPPYPTITIPDGRKSIRLLVHVAILTTFSETKPNGPNIVVDHINRNKIDYHIDNLRFVSYGENNKNRDIPKEMYNAALIDKQTFQYVSFLKHYSKKEIRKFERLITPTTFINYFTDDLLKLVQEGTISFKDLEKTHWVKISEIFEISKYGVLRKKKKNGYFYTLGTKNYSGYFRVTLDKNKQKLVHFLVAKEFINGGKDIPSDIVIDHIDTNRGNNNFLNLRLVSQSENMNNPISLEKRNNIIGCNNCGDLIYFSSQKSCAEILGVSEALISKSITQEKVIKPYLTKFWYVPKNELYKYRLINNFSDLKMY